MPSSVPDELVSASAVQIAHQVRNRSLSPVKIAELFLGRIEAHRHLNAFITVNPALVMEEAEGLAHRLKRGEDPGPLAGVPVGVKDLMSVRGYPLTAGTKAIEAKVQERDAPVVARLRAAGALIVGTTNLHELAFGINSANPHFGHVQNPRYPGYIPGGSSGGSAAAVAAELAAIGVGSCTASSASRRPTTPCRAKACIPWPGHSITSGRSRAASKMRESLSKSWRGCRNTRCCHKARSRRRES